MDQSCNDPMLVRRAVLEFHRRVCSDGRLATYLIEGEPGRQRARMADALTQTLAGRKPCRAGDLLAAPGGRQLSDADFDLLGHHLLDTLLTLRVGPDALLRVGTALGQARSAVLGG